MDKQDVIAFFDRAAATWDAEMIKSDTIINRILDNAEVGEGMTVPKDPIHCPPSIGGKRVPFRREAKRQSTLPPITLRHKAQDFSSKGVPSSF